MPFAVYALPSDNYKYTAGDKGIISAAQGTFPVGNGGSPVTAAFDTSTLGGILSASGSLTGSKLVFIGPLNGTSCSTFRSDCYKQYQFIVVDSTDSNSGSYISFQYYRNLPNPNGTNSNSVGEIKPINILDSDGTDTPPPAVVPCDPSRYTADISGIVYKDKKDPANIIASRDNMVGLNPDMGLPATEVPADTDGGGRYKINDVLNSITNSECNGDSYKVFVKYRVDNTFLDILKAKSLIDAAVKQDEEVWLVGETTVTIDKDGNVSNGDIIVKEVRYSALDKAISNAIKWVMSGVKETLRFVMTQINLLLVGTADLVVGKAGADVSKASMRGPWISVRNIALSLLVMALVIIAFANVLQINLEQYGVTRMIPRIIISIIMAYASWIIVIFFFDFTAAIQAQAIYLAGGIDILGTLSNFDTTVPKTGDIVTNLGIMIMVIIILLGVIACGIVLLFTLLIRIVMLCFLLVVAPLAFILNIMPFTANMYKQWWSEFFKWMFMGPIAMAIIALGGLIAQNAGYSGENGAGDLTSAAALADFSSSGRSGALIGLIIFAAALYMAATLPMQWGGSIMKSWTGAGKKLWGATGANALKGAGWAATRVGGKYSINRMMGKGKSFLDNRKANQAAEDKAHLLGFQDKLANSKIPGSTWATTGVAGTRGEMAANNLHVATVAAHHAAAGMGDESTSKEKLMSFTGAQHDQYTREAAVTELMRRGLLDMDANELKRFGGSTILDKDGKEQGAQGLFDEFVGKSDAMKNLGIKSHKELIFGSQSDAVTADFRRKAAKKMIDGDLSASTGAEIGGLLKYAKPMTDELRGQVKAQGDNIKSGDLDTRSITGNDQDVLMAGLANEFTSNITPLQASELIKKKGAPRMTKLYDAATGEAGATNFRQDTVDQIKEIMGK